MSKRNWKETARKASESTIRAAEKFRTTEKVYVPVYIIMMFLIAFGSGALAYGVFTSSIGKQLTTAALGEAGAVTQNGSWYRYDIPSNAYVGTNRIYMISEVKNVTKAGAADGDPVVQFMPNVDTLSPFGNVTWYSFQLRFFYTSSNLEATELYNITGNKSSGNPAWDWVFKPFYESYMARSLHTNWSNTSDIDAIAKPMLPYTGGGWGKTYPTDPYWEFWYSRKCSISPNITRIYTTYFEKDTYILTSFMITNQVAIIFNNNTAYTSSGYTFELTGWSINGSSVFGVPPKPQVDFDVTRENEFSWEYTLKVNMKYSNKYDLVLNSNSSGVENKSIVGCSVTEMPIKVTSNNTGVTITIKSYYFQNYTSDTVTKSFILTEPKKGNVLVNTTINATLVNNTINMNWTPVPGANAYEVIADGLLIAVTNETSLNYQPGENGTVEIGVIAHSSEFNTSSSAPSNSTIVVSLEDVVTSPGDYATDENYVAAGLDLQTTFIMISIIATAVFIVVIFVVIKPFKKMTASRKRTDGCKPMSM